MGNPNTTPASRAYAVRDAQEFGMIGLLDSITTTEDKRAAGGAPAATATTFAGAAAAPAAKPPANRFGDDIGGGGLGLNGVGPGGGGDGEGIGLGKGNTLGHGHAAKAPAPQRAPSTDDPSKDISTTLRGEAPTVTGSLPPEVVQRIVRQNFGRFRFCFDSARRTDPTVHGRVTTKFVIDAAGDVASVSVANTDLRDANLVRCVSTSFGNLSFPQPTGGSVTVLFPLTFGPDGPIAPPDATTPSPASSTNLALVGHQAHPCSPGADLTFDERRILWRERLGASPSAAFELEVYRRALADCEAPGWRERHTLLVEMVNHLHSIAEKVALWRALLANSMAADVVYRATLAQVQTAAELHDLHVALGLRSVDSDLLAGLLARAKTAADRLVLIHATSLKWPDDQELALRVLDAYEDAADDAAGRAWARRLRHRADATPHVYTNVGEYYLRLSARESGAAAARDSDEARRTFGELVEFAPEDPVARRRLGDLLRAHGWYDEAFRQYETLAQLTPDDAAVPLLLAEAAQGLGRTEEAVSWAEKAASAGSPDGTSPLSMAARASASAFLAWARDDATRAGRKDDAERLLARAKRLAGNDAAPSGHVRFLTTWSHPELHPVLWTSTTGAPMPAQDSFPLFGVAEAVVPASPTPTIELRLDPEDAARAARMGAHAVVTALVDEGAPTERIVRLDVGFGDAAHPIVDLKVVLDNGALRAEAP
jgi:tetratricopeptide (TPR) repeat protein